VYVAEIVSAAAWRPALARLEELEQTGIEPRTRLGFGRILAFDPFHAAHAPKSECTTTLANWKIDTEKVEP
jgi:hypothetical protein